MTDLIMNVHTCVTDNTTYAMLYVRSMSDLMMNVHTCMYIHQYILHCDLAYNMVLVVLSVTHVCTFIIKSDIVI
jgi:hypothetical protein